MLAIAVIALSVLLTIAWVKIQNQHDSLFHSRYENGVHNCQLWHQIIKFAHTPPAKAAVFYKKTGLGDCQAYGLFYEKG